ncbi:hypothetical protein Lalb_Chr17g0336521 [Lupinus albus]|uniref:Uncharacterized protein n=1 Tax=Lupinus albus TaxID=3870 RepID=A0A6A4P0V2_LUPAL|nr:hypothetical protein Lalb_Chr17g0336521 [Lupinus albus]
MPTTMILYLLNKFSCKHCIFNWTDIVIFDMITCCLLTFSSWLFIFLCINSIFALLVHSSCLF